MIRARVLVVVGMISALAVAGCRGERVVEDLIQTFPAARQQPGPDAFEIVQAKIKDDTRPAILVKAPSRITWKVEVPSNGWLKAGVALREDAWTTPGDGVMFEVRITYTKSGQMSNDQLTSIVVNPYGNPADRAWHDVAVDLSEHAGTAVELIFNTRSSWSPQGAAPKDDRAGDLALWGAPRLTAR
jgi:hypothetical protein